MALRPRPSVTDDGVDGPDLVLASGSPRRRELLEGLGFTIEVRPADIDETPLPDEDPVAYVMRLAREKSARVPFFASGLPVVAADTTVDLDGRILAKPDDDDHAAKMLRMLRGRIHTVHTGVAVAKGDDSAVIAVTTEVEFSAMTDDQIAWYVRSGEPRGKAGAYAIQGAGGAFVRAVRGSVSNVIGLPLSETLELLAAVGVTLR